MFYYTIYTRNDVVIGSSEKILKKYSLCSVLNEEAIVLKRIYQKDLNDNFKVYELKPLDKKPDNMFLTKAKAEYEKLYNKPIESSKIQDTGKTYIYNVAVSNHPGVYSYLSTSKLELYSICIVNFINKYHLGIILEEISEDDITFDKKKLKNIVALTGEYISENNFKLMNFIKQYYVLQSHLIYPVVYNLNYKKYQASKKYLEKIENIKLDLDVNLEPAEYLTKEQQAVVNKAYSSDKYVLIHGVTGSGKTEIYIEIIKKYIKKGKNVIMLVPEIALTTQLFARFKKQFKDLVGVYHSKINSKDKIILEEQIKRGNIKVVIGTRSALFSPLQNIGAIIIDEEHEQSYKQVSNLPYHAKTVAFKKAMLENAKIILGSATPSFDTLKFVDEGKIEKIDIFKRYNNQKMPEFKIRISDVYNNPLDSNILKDIKEKIEKDEQVILLYNRKSYNTIVRGKESKKVLECPNCSNTLNYLKKENKLRCVYCDYKIKPPQTHPETLEELEYIGFGTEKIEEELQNAFGQDIILRMDTDVLNTDKKIKEAYNSILNKSKKIITGTQMISKGFHFPDVTLVVVLNLNQLFFKEDFKSVEHVYQLVTQTAGRAGRASKEGTVIIQTTSNHNDFAKKIIEQEYMKFYREQLEIRKVLYLPPISKMLTVSTLSKYELKSKDDLITIYNIIKKHTENKKVYMSISQMNQIKRERIYISSIDIFSDNKDISYVKNILKKIIEKEIVQSNIFIDVY